MNAIDDAFYLWIGCIVEGGGGRCPKTSVKNCPVLSEISALLLSKHLTALKSPFILVLSLAFYASSSKCLDTIS